MAALANPGTLTVPHFVAQQVVSEGRKHRDSTLATNDLAGAIAQVQTRTQIFGASTLTVSLVDPEWEVQTSGLFDLDAEGLLAPIDVNFPEGSDTWWRLCTTSGTTDLSAANFTLTFEDRIVAYLREHWGPKAARPGTTTRAQFIAQLVREVHAGGGIRFVCPSIGRLQPIDTSHDTQANANGSVGTVVLTKGQHRKLFAKANKRRGIGRAAAVTIKGAQATAPQIAVANELIDEADKLKAGSLATTAMLCAAIAESTMGADARTFGGPYQGVLQGQPSQVDVHSPTAMAEAFQKGIKGFQGGGGMKLARILTDPGEIATKVEASGQPAHFYGQWAGEAAALLDAYGGLASGSQGGANVPISDVSQLARGTTSDPDEDSWDCITRLAQEVSWELFTDANTLYYMDGPDLAAQEPAAYIDRAERTCRDRDGTVTDDVISSLQYTVDNTAFVYTPQTRRVRGKVRRGRRVAKPQTPTQITLSMLCEPDAYRAGELFVVRNAGSADGRWIVTDATRNWLGEEATMFMLGPPTEPKPEPQGRASTANGQKSTPKGSPPSDVVSLGPDARVANSPLSGKFHLIGIPFEGTHGKAFNVAGGSDNWESENAVDLRVRYGTPVLAVDDGTIGPEIGSLGTGGRFAGLRLHLVTANNEWYYAHLSRLDALIKPGYRVKAGNVLGWSGAANGVDHLHLACNAGNPMSLLGLKLSDLPSIGMTPPPVPK